MSAPRYLPLTLLAIALTLALPSAPASGQQKPDPPKGTMERITVHGRSLEGNLEGDSPDREVTVYLPPSYPRDQNRRYPVIYLLHGYGGRDNTFTERLASLQESADRLGSAQGFSEPPAAE